MSIPPMSRIYYCCDCWKGGYSKEKAESQPFDPSYHGWHGSKDKHCVHLLPENNLNHTGEAIKYFITKSKD